MDVFLFLRGHNEPGGGFGGGLVASGAVALYATTHSAAAAQHVVRVSPRVLIRSGLLIALSSGLAPV